MLYQASGKPALVEDVLHLVGHLALLSLVSDGVLESASDAGRRLGKR